MLGRLSIVAIAAAILMIPTGLSAQMGGAVSPGVHVGGAVNPGATDAAPGRGVSIGLAPSVRKALPGRTAGEADG